MDRAVDGSDYIFNRYAYLGVEKDSSVADIEDAISKKKSQNHPDRTIHLSDELKAQATRAWELTLKCEEVLCKPERRKIFDERLAWFEAEHPKLISTNGNPIIDLSRGHIFLDVLTKGDAPDQTKQTQMLDAMSGYNPKTLMVLERLYLADPDNPDTHEAYQDALKQKLAYLSGKELLAWENAGISGYENRMEPLHYFDDYQDGVAGLIETYAEELIPAHAQQEVFAYLPDSEIAQIQALPAPNDDPITESITTITNKAAIIVGAVLNFKSRTHTITELATQKQEVIKQLLGVCPYHELVRNNESAETEVFLLVENEGREEVFLSFTFNSETNNARGNDEYRGKTLEELKELNLPSNACAIVYEKEIGEPMVHITFAHSKFHGLDKEVSQEL